MPDPFEIGYLFVMTAKKNGNPAKAENLRENNVKKKRAIMKNINISTSMWSLRDP